MECRPRADGAFERADQLSVRQCAAEKVDLTDRQTVSVFGGIVGEQRRIELEAAAPADVDAGIEFLGSQGDIWDAQKDMLADTLGAMFALFLFAIIRPDRGPAATRN